MRLSFDRALFGQVPSGATVRRLVVLRNIADCACDFAWDTSHPLWGTILSVYPSHGTLQPGKHMCCKLTLIAVGPPEELRASLECTLRPHVDPNALTTSEAALVAAEANAGSLGLLPPTHPLASGTTLRPRSPPRVSVTEHKPKLRGLQALLHIEERESRRQAAAAGLTAQEYAATAQLTQRAPLTLAPNAVAKQQQAIGGGGFAQMAKVLLDVRACISPPDVLVAGKVDLSTFYMPRTTQPIEAPPVPSIGAVTSSPATLPPLAPLQQEQRGAVESFVMQMLKEVLQDPAVTRAVATTEVAPTPWFRQIASKAAAAPPPAAPAPAAEDASVPLGSMAAGAAAAPPVAGRLSAPPAAPNVAPAAPAAVTDVSAPAVVGGELGTESGAAAAAALDEYALEAEMEERDRMARAQRRAAEVERRRREAEEGEKVRSSAEFQELVAYVLEGTLFNLVSEVAAAEFALDTVPRQIVRTLEITEDTPEVS